MYKQEYLYHAPLHHVAYSCHGRFSGLLRSAKHVVRADLAKMWMKVFIRTRFCAALRAADLDWIIGPGYSLGGYILEKTMKNQPGTKKNH